MFKGILKDNWPTKSFNKLKCQPFSSLGWDSFWFFRKKYFFLKSIFCLILRIRPGWVSSSLFVQKSDIVNQLLCRIGNKNQLNFSHFIWKSIGTKVSFKKLQMREAKLEIQRWCWTIWLNQPGMDLKTLERNYLLPFKEKWWMLRRSLAIIYDSNLILQSDDSNYWQSDMIATIG